MTNLSDLCFKAHRRACENWQEGDIKEVWREKEILCIRYTSGNWWHYGFVGDNVIWW